MNTKKKLFPVLLVAVAAIAIAVLLGVKSFSDRSDKHVDPEMNTTDIQGMLNDIGELATAEYYYTIAQTADKPAKTVAGFEIPFTSSKVMYSYEGSVKAGIEFQEIEVTVDEATKMIYIHLPKAVILSSEVFFESLIVYDEKYSPFNTFTFSDMNLSVESAQTAGENAALDNGLLDRANENAQNIIATTVKGVYAAEEYQIEFY